MANRKSSILGCATPNFENSGPQFLISLAPDFSPYCPPISQNFGFYGVGSRNVGTRLDNAMENRKSSILGCGITFGGTRAFLLS